MTTGTRLLAARRLRQMAKETTRGTVVAAVHQTAWDLSITPTATVHRPKPVNGRTMRNRGNEIVVTRGAAINIGESEVAFNEMQRAFGMSLQAGITPTTPGGGTLSREWAYARIDTGVFAPDTFTVEDGHYDGTLTYARRYPYWFLTDWTLTFTPDRPVMFSANGIARHDVATASANTLTDLSSTYPVALTHVAGQNCAVSFHDTYASIGSGAALGSDFISATIRCTTGYEENRTLDGSAELNFTSFRFNADNAGLDVEFLVQAKSGTEDFFQDQLANAEAQTGQAFRFSTVGALIEGSLFNQLRIDCWVKPEAGSYQPSGVQDGQETVSFRYVDTKPVNGGNYLDVLLRNTSTAATY